MIWTSGQGGGEGPSARLTECVLRRMRAACGPDRDEAPHLREVARGVAAYVEEERRNGVCLAPHSVSLLAARALGATGQTEAARRMMLLGTGLVRSVPSALVGEGGAMWVLDLEALTALSADRIEMVFLGALERAIEGTAGVWDAAGGTGALGLKGLVPAVEAVLGQGARRSRRAQFAAEIRRTCAERLNVIGSRRSWKDTPLIVELNG